MARKSVLGALLLLAACGGGDDSPGATAAGGGAGGSAGGAAGASGAAGATSAGAAGAPQNGAPTWSDAVETLDLREGETTALPLTLVDPDGDEVAATVSAGDGWQASIVQGKLVVDALLDGADSSTMTVSLDDGKGGVTAVGVKINVARRRWGAAVKLQGAGVEEREHPSLILDEKRGRVLVFGGSGYKPYGTPLGDLSAVALEGGAVTKLTGTGDLPGPGGSKRVAQVPGQSVAYLFGGYGQTDTNDLFRVDFSGEEPSFTRLTQVKPPAARGLHMFAYDAQQDRFFVFGGVGSLGGIFSDFWSGQRDGDTVTWTKLKLTPGPSPRYGFFQGVDQKKGVVYLFSGAQGTSSLDPARDLWKLDMRADPPSWTKLLEGDAVPEGRRNGASVYDEQREQFHVWGGTPDAMNSSPGYWVYDARASVNAWYELKREGEPPLRSSSAGVVEPSTGTVRVGFGNTTKAIYADLTPFGF